jgi:hypothetical protein
MEDNHLQNLAVFLETFSKKHNLLIYSIHIDEVKAELLRRGMNFQDIIAQGFREFSDSAGVKRVWDSETDQDVIIN